MRIFPERYISLFIEFLLGFLRIVFISKMRNVLGSGLAHNPGPTPAVMPSSKFTLKSGMLRDGLEVLEYPFLTLHTFPEVLFKEL